MFLYIALYIVTLDGISMPFKTHNVPFSSTVVPLSDTLQNYIPNGGTRTRICQNGVLTGRLMLPWFLTALLYRYDLNIENCHDNTTNTLLTNAELTISKSTVIPGKPS